MTGLCTLVAVVSMALRVPEAAISAYLVFFVTKEDSLTTAITGAGVLAAATVGIGLSLLFFLVVMDEPALRLPLMAAMIFVGMYFSRVSSVGPIGFALGFITTLALTAADLMPVPEIVVRGLLWLWVIVAYPTVLVVLANLALGYQPVDVFRLRLGAVLRRLAEGMAGNSHLDAEGIRDDLAELAKQVAENRDAQSGGRLVALSYLDQTAMLASQAMGRSGVSAIDRERLARTCAALASSVAEGRETGPESVPLETLPPSHAALFQSLDHACRAMDGRAAPTEGSPAGKPGLLVKDAFTNPEYRRFALKTTLACMVAYVTYTGLSWPGIRTALITCFFVALSSHGETMHKLRMRMVGAGIGAAMGMAAILWIIPRLDSVGGLAGLVAAGTLPAAWLATGKSRYRYAGWQIAFAFFLCVLHGFGPSGDLVVARDRLIGIFLGNVVMTVVFTHVWPVRHRLALFAGLADAVDVLRAWVNAPTAGPDPTDRARVAAGFQTRITACREGLHLLRYERKWTNDGDAAQALRLVESLYVPALGLAGRTDDESRGRRRAEFSAGLAELAVRLRAGGGQAFQVPGALTATITSLRGIP